MSACIFFASDAPLPGVFPPPEYDYLAINVDDGTIDDGGADDNFALRTYPDSFLYTDKAFAVCLDWAYYTEGRARQLIDYIGSALESAPCVELWHVWQGGFYSFDERPVIHRAAVRFDEFVEDDLRELGETDLWNSKEANRLSFYCLSHGEQYFPYFTKRGDSHVSLHHIRRSRPPCGRRPPCTVSPDAV